MLITSRALPRRLLVATSGLVLVAASLTALSSPADAATTTVTVVGTSDVYDSGLIQSVIAPGFRAVDPSYKLNYISEGTGKAITDAENGVADALIVHAPSLENSFVDGDPIGGGANIGKSYSLEGPGRAIFYGDYILAGGTTDPAAVDPGYPTPATDIVQAFTNVSTAGAAGNANFVSRGGTPGTTVQEHLIWAQVPDAATFTCQVSSANGGGDVPSMTDLGQPCPTTVTYPAWYHVTGLTQGPNIVNANTCNYPTATTSGHNNCYVFTDRGTYDYLSEDSTSQTGNLEVVVRDSSADLLINTFHAYAINPAAVGVTLNTAGATAFLNYLTSPAAQVAIGNYLSDVDSVPPFNPDAAPAHPTSALPGTSPGKKSVTVTGTLKNLVPGTPALANIAGLQLLAAPTATANATFVPVATATTDPSGGFTFTFTPSVNQTYKLFTPAITQVEDGNLTPTFKDTLQSTSTSLGTINVQGVVADETAQPSTGHLKVTGSLYPLRTGNKATLTLYARKSTSTGSYTNHGVHALTAGGHGFSATYTLPKGKWSFYVKYANPGYITSGVSATQTVTVS